MKAAAGTLVVVLILCTGGAAGVAGCSGRQTLPPPEAGTMPAAATSAIDKPVHAAIREEPRRLELADPTAPPPQATGKLELPTALSPLFAPSIALLTLNGEPAKLEDYNSEVLLINFWASWCEPCIREIPMLEALEEQFADLGLTVLHVAVSDSPTRVARFLASQHLALRVAIDADGSALEAFGFKAVPAAVLINRRGALMPFPDPLGGRQVYATEGPRDWLNSRFVEFLRTYLQ